MKLRKIIVGSTIYMVWSVLIGFFIPYLTSWAAIISSLTAGIYSGYKSKLKEAIVNGFLSGFIGGFVLGVASLYFNDIYGIPLSVSIANFLLPIINIFSSVFWFSVPSLAILGSVLGIFGGLMGSITKLRKIFLFLTLFTLFLFYAALDNLAWWWGRAPWNWSISVVLTHWIDISVALVFALFVMILAYFLKIY